jgi:hypothetical protein
LESEEAHKRQHPALALFSVGFASRRSTVNPCPNNGRAWVLFRPVPDRPSVRRGHFRVWGPLNVYWRPFCLVSVVPFAASQSVGATNTPIRSPPHTVGVYSIGSAVAKLITSATGGGGLCRPAPCRSLVVR